MSESKEKIMEYVGELKSSSDTRPWMYIVLLIIGIFSGNTDRIANYMSEPHVKYAETNERMDNLESTVYNLVEALSANYEENSDAEKKEPHINDNKKLPINKY